MNSGWKGLFAIEKDAFAFSTLKFNLVDCRTHFDWPNWLSLEAHDINEILAKHKAELKKLSGQVDLVAGGPPCQGFSINGRRNEKDKRNELIQAYVQFVALLRPKLLFFENVRGFTMSFAKAHSRTIYSEQVSDHLRALGYQLQWFQQFESIPRSM